MGARQQERMKLHLYIPVNTISTMLLISLMVAFLSPLTTLVVKSDSVPKINIFKSEFFTPISDPHKTKHLKLRCVATADPRAEIKFFFHANDASYGKELKNLSNVVKISETEIQIKNISSADTGTYRCYAINKNGKVFKNMKVAVPVPGTFNKGAYYRDPPTTIPIELGRDQEIICPVKTYPYPLNFAWGSKQRRKLPLFIKENDRIHITEKGNLYYSLIQQQDVDQINGAGGISCIMTYDGEAVHSRRYKLNVVKENVSHIAPSLHVKLTGTTYILKGATQTLRCVGGGNPAPHITWFKDGVLIMNNDSNYRIDPKQPGVLKIYNFHPDLAGNYKCTLTNQLGRVESDGNVILAAAPKIGNPFPALKVAYLRNRLELRCHAKGILPITYEWYKDGRSLNSYKTIGRRMEINEGRLLISPVLDDTKGTYQCYAINSYGNTYTNTKVVVKDPPRPTVIHGGQVAGKITTPPLVIVPTRKSGKEIDSDDPLQLKYIIIIACSGAVCLVLVGGGICMYCRSKDNSEKIIYVPPTDKGVSRNDAIKKELSRTDIKSQLLLDLANLPPPPPSLTDQSDDDFSSYGGGGGYKTNHPLYYNDNTMMYLLNHNKDEHLYADIPEDFTRCESDTPSTEL